MNQKIAVLVIIFIIIFLISLIIFFYCSDQNTIVEEINLDPDSSNHDLLDIETNLNDINESSPIINYFFVSTNHPEIECPICLEPINNCHISQFICLHKYHQDCLNEWNNKRCNDIICPECGI